MDAAAVPSQSSQSRVEDADLRSVWPGPQQRGCGYKAERHLTQGGADSLLEEGCLSELKGEGDCWFRKSRQRQYVPGRESCVCEDPEVTGVDQASATCLLQGWASGGDLGSKAQRGIQASAGKTTGSLEGHSGILVPRAGQPGFRGRVDSQGPVSASHLSPTGCTTSIAACFASPVPSSRSLSLDFPLTAHCHQPTALSNLPAQPGLTQSVSPYAQGRTENDPFPLI